MSRRASSKLTECADTCAVEGTEMTSAWSEFMVRPFYPRTGRLGRARTWHASLAGLRGENLEPARLVRRRRLVDRPGVLQRAELPDLRPTERHAQHHQDGADAAEHDAPGC